MNTKGLVQRVASLTVSLHVCVGKGRGAFEVDGLDGYKKNK